MFKKIVINAMIIGFIVGTVFGVLQIFTTSPIIIAAEVYEVGASAQAGHDIERSVYTVLTSVLTAIGLAMLVLSAMAAAQKAGVLNGVLFGLAGYIAFYLAPTLSGLLPEIPGTIATQLEGRQASWLFAVIMTALGLACLAFIGNYYRLFGFVLIALPHIIGASVLEKHAFFNTDPDAVLALTQLTNEFIVMTTIVLLVFWLLLGAVSGYFANRFASEDL